MVDLVGTTAYTVFDNVSSHPEYIDNLFSQFQLFNTSDSVTSVHTSSIGGLTCIYNVVDNINGIGNWTFVSTTSSTGVTGTRGNYVLICISFDALVGAAYEPYMLGQNDSTIIGTFGM